MHGGWESPEKNEKSALGLAASHTHWWFVGFMMFNEFNGNFAEFCFFNLGPQTSLHYSCTMVHACRHREFLDFGVPNVREAPLSMIPLPDITYHNTSYVYIYIYIYIYWNGSIAIASSHFIIFHHLDALVLGFCLQLLVASLDHRLSPSAPIVEALCDRTSRVVGELSDKCQTMMGWRLSFDPPEVKHGNGKSPYDWRFEWKHRESRTGGLFITMFDTSPKGMFKHFIFSMYTYVTQHIVIKSIILNLKLQGIFNYQY